MEAAQPVKEAQRPGVNTNPGTQRIPKPPVLIMLSGLPGTGKSYLANKLGERLPFMIVESDAVRKQLFPRPSHSARENTSVFGVIHFIIADLLKNKISVIFDATNLEEKHRKTVYKIAANEGARLVIIEVEAPVETVKKRLASRAQNQGNAGFSDATWSTYQKMQRTAEGINRPCHTVNTQGNIAAAIEKIVKDANR
jgi:predicted kinase